MTVSIWTEVVAGLDCFLNELLLGSFVGATVKDASLAVLFLVGLEDLDLAREEEIEIGVLTGVATGETETGEDFAGEDEAKSFCLWICGSNSGVYSTLDDSPTIVFPFSLLVADLVCTPVEDIDMEATRLGVAGAVNSCSISVLKDPILILFLLGYVGSTLGGSGGWRPFRQQTHSRKEVKHPLKIAQPKVLLGHDV